MGIRYALLFLLIIPFASGCEKKPPKKYPVAGTIATKGTPLTHGVVIFEPDDKQGNTDKNEYRSRIDNGTYQLQDGGAPAGHYRIAVFAMTPADQTGFRPPEWQANERYTDAKKSGLRFEVVEKPEAGRYDLNLEP